MVVAILAVGIYSLVFERRHYEIFYKQPVEQMVKASVEFAKQHPDKKLLVMIQDPEKYMGYYLNDFVRVIQLLPSECADDLEHFASGYNNDAALKLFEAAHYLRNK